jgi:hypothetical protein
MTAASERAASSAQRLADDRFEPGDPCEYQVAVLSAALLRTVMTASGEGLTPLAVRAGTTSQVVSGAVSGTCPAWALPYREFAAPAAAAAAASWGPEVFETATACDLLLTCVLSGEQAMATDVLTRPSSHSLARVLLRLALTGVLANSQPQLLHADVLALLTERAAELASSPSPDAWAGLEILAIQARASARHARRGQRASAVPRR